MRLALYQGPSPSGDLAAAFAAVERTLAAASAMGAEIAVFPEVFLPGYNAASMLYQPLDGEWSERLGELTADAGVALVIGVAERDGDETYNTASAFGPDGRLLARYRKIQLFGPREASLYAPGDEYVTFDFLGRTIGLLICYDVEFPEHARALARLGADLILIPTANMKPYDNVNRYAVAARAMENGVTVAYCNYCGVEGDLDYVGGSLIASPEGESVALAGAGEALLIADLPAPGDMGERPTEHLADLRRIDIKGDD